MYTCVFIDAITQKWNCIQIFGFFILKRKIREIHKNVFCVWLRTDKWVWI